MIARMFLGLGMLGVGILGGEKVQAQGVEFIPVAIDVSQNCNTIILQGTQRFKGTAFVTPKVFLSVNKNRKRLFEIIPDAETDDAYIVRMGLFIPLDARSSIPYRLNNNQLYSHACDFNQIRKMLAAKNRDNGTTPVLRLAPLPIRKITVKLDGIDTPAVIGDETTDALDYFGLDQVVEFRLKNRQELRNLISRLNGEIGLGIRVGMTFSARTSSEYLRVSFDAERIASALEATFEGKVRVIDAELTAGVVRILQSQNLQVYQEGGNQAVTDMAMNLITKFITESNDPGAYAGGPTATTTPVVPKLPPVNPTLPGFPRNPVVPGPRSLNETAGTGDTGGGTTPGPFESAPSVPSPPPPGPVNGGSYSVKALLKYLRGQRRLELVYQRLSDELTKSFQTSTIVRADLEEITSSNYKVRSRTESDPSMTSVSSFILRKGSQIDISVTGKTIEPLDETSETETRYLNKDEVVSRLLPLKGQFPVLSRIAMDDLTETDSANGNQATFLETPSLFWAFLRWPAYGIPTEYLKRVVSTFWGMDKITRQYSPEGTEQTLETNQTLLSKLPLKFRFSKMAGRLFTIAEMSVKNDAFDLRFSGFEGKLVLTAKKELGYIFIFNEEKAPTRTMVAQRYFEVSQNLISPKLNRTKQLIFNKEVPIYQSLYSVHIDSAGTGGGIPQNPQLFQPKRSIYDNIVAP